MKRGAALLELQDVDLEVLRSQKRLDEMPEKRLILEVRHKTRDVTALRAKANELVSRLGAAVSRHEDECAMIATKLDDEQAKLMSGDVTNPKMVMNITREMDALKRRKDKLEMEEIELMERVEKAKGQVAKVDAALGQLSAKEASLTNHYKTKGSEMISEIDRLKARREELTHAVDAQTLTTYETIRESKGGVGAGRLAGTMCTACRMDLPAERVAELKSGPDLAMCPQCRRLIVITPAEDQE
ncbi:MAG: C4-type zinc ribbon domain-containing protein [Actinomycetota bacterium]|nr:C4-type zinc ribbon domain-containing protein [Actinomycetota bacterium]